MGQTESSCAAKPSPLQPFEKPAGVNELWELGLDKNHELLEKALRPFLPTKFYVTSEATERHLAEICDMFEKSRDENARNALHHAMFALNGDAACRLLALGMNPSAVDCAGRTPAHWMVMKRSVPPSTNSKMGLVLLAQTLSLCRPALFAVDWEKKTAHFHAIDRLQVSCLSFHVSSEL